MAAADRQPPELTWEVLDSEALVRLANVWDRLVTDSGYPPFMQSPFLLHLFGGFNCNMGFLALARDGRRPLAGGILVPAGRGLWSTYQPSQLPLGAWVMAPDCDWRTASRSLLKALPGSAISLGVTQQDPRLAPRPTDEAEREVLDYVATGWIDVGGSFEEFWQSRGKNLRQNLPKLRRRLEERGERLAFEFVEHPDAVEAALLDFAALESAGWKAEGGTAISAKNQQGLFYRETLRDYAERGSGFAIRLTVGGRPIAVDFGVRDAETLVLLKTTYDENFKAFSPAQLLHEQAFEYIFQRRLAKRIEFYGKLMEWHTRWTEQSRMLYHVNVFRSPLLRRARNVARWARQRTQQARSRMKGG